MKKGALFTTIGSVIILVISFIAFILPSSFSGFVDENSKESFGKYKSREVKYEKDSVFVANLQSSFQEYSSKNGNQEPSFQGYYDIYYSAFEETIKMYAFEDAVNKSGYKVPEEKVNRQLRTLFTNPDGTFNNAMYQQADQNDIGEYKKQMLKAEVSERYDSDLFGSKTELISGIRLYGMKESEAELSFIEAMDLDKRAFNMIALKKSDFPEEEILKFANSNKNKFVKYNMSIVTFAEKNDANKASKQIAEGKKSFEEIASESQETRYKDSEGKLTYPYYYQYSLENIFNNKEDIDTIAKLADNEVSTVIELSNGYAILKKNAASENPDFADVNLFRDVTNYINSYETNLVEDYFINIANNFINTAKASDFDAACEKLNLTKTEVPEFAMNYGGHTFTTSVNSSLPGLKFADTNEDFLKTAFTLKENELSKPMVMRDDMSTGYVIVIQYKQTQKAEDSDYDLKPIIAYQISEFDKVSAKKNIMKSKFVTDTFVNALYTF